MLARGGGLGRLGTDGWMHGCGWVGGGVCACIHVYGAYICEEYVGVRVRSAYVCMSVRECVWRTGERVQSGGEDVTI